MAADRETRVVERQKCGKQGVVELLSTRCALYPLSKLRPKHTLITQLVFDGLRASGYGLFECTNTLLRMVWCPLLTKLFTYADSSFDLPCS